MKEGTERVNKLSKLSIKTETPASRKKGLTAADVRIINQIIQMGRDYSAKTIASWKKAVKLAEDPMNPNRVKLYDLFEDLVYDLHYVSIKRNLLTSATGSRYNVIDTKTEQVDKEATALFKTAWYEEFVEHVTDTFFQGHTLLQINEANPVTGSVKLELIPRKNVVPEKGAWVPMAGTHDYKYYRDTPAMDWLIELGKCKDLGMLNLLAKEIIFKKVAFICWSAFQERFGNPLVKAKTNSRDTKAMDKMEAFLREMATNSYIIIDNADDVDFVKADSTDVIKVFDGMIERVNSEMSKAVLLNIMSSDIGSNGSRAQAEVHSNTGEKAIKAFLRMVEQAAKEYLFPKLIQHGFTMLEGKTLKYVEEKNVSKEAFEQHKWLDENFEVDFQFWGETYGVPIKARKEVKQPGTESGANPLQPGGAGGGNAPTPEQLKRMQKLAADTRHILNMHLKIHELYNHKH